MEREFRRNKLIKDEETIERILKKSNKTSKKLKKLLDSTKNEVIIEIPDETE